jgi:PhnB protein
MPKTPPPGFTTVTAYLYIQGAAAAIDFYKKAFGAEERFRMPGPDGRIGHAEIKIGDSVIMMADEHGEIDALGPKSRGGATSSIMLYVEDVDKRFEQAVAAGATVLSPVENKFYGDRMGTVADPFGHCWHIATVVEDVSPEEMKKRLAAMGEQK